MAVHETPHQRPPDYVAPTNRRHQWTYAPSSTSIAGQQLNNRHHHCRPVSPEDVVLATFNLLFDPRLGIPHLIDPLRTSTRTHLRLQRFASHNVQGAVMGGGRALPHVRRRWCHARDGAKVSAVSTRIFPSVSSTSTSHSHRPPHPSCAVPLHPVLRSSFHPSLDYTKTDTDTEADIPHFGIALCLPPQHPHVPPSHLSPLFRLAFAFDIHFYYVHAPYSLARAAARLRPTVRRKSGLGGTLWLDYRLDAGVGY
ncbi:hypothetical protein R3P38DRAFT_3193033 [Favolaschia claudopus]|uniref:Uncharacterized protein n=1 Tax=Favolaschia claudopus TaxID=2862362 RepID=A0AAW0BKE6_9AGAR